MTTSWINEDVQPELLLDKYVTFYVVDRPEMTDSTDSTLKRHKGTVCTADFEDAILTVTYLDLNDHLQRFDVDYDLQYVRAVVENEVPAEETDESPEMLTLDAANPFTTAFDEPPQDDKVYVNENVLTGDLINKVVRLEHFIQGSEVPFVQYGMIATLIRTRGGTIYIRFAHDPEPFRLRPKDVETFKVTVVG